MSGDCIMAAAKIEIADSLLLLVRLTVQPQMEGENIFNTTPMYSATREYMTPQMYTEANLQNPTHLRLNDTRKKI